MCDPVTLATIAVVTTATQVITEVQAAKNQKAAITAQLAESEQQIETKQTAELNDRARAARREQAKIKVAAGEAGLSLTGSVESLLADTVMQQQLSTERTNLNAETEKRSVRAEANSMYSRIQQPSLIGAGLRIAMAGGTAYAGASASSKAAAAG